MDDINVSKDSNMVVDRIEGEFIIVEVTDNNNADTKPQYLHLPVSLFHSGVEEGMKVHIEKETELRCTITFLAVSKEDRLEEAQARLNRLKSRDPQEDIIDL